MKDIEFRSFEHVSQRDMTYTKFTFHDNANYVIEHDYLLTVILRYLTSR